jgi:fructokinase
MTGHSAVTARVLVGGVEGGGTKFVCAVGTGPGDVRARARIPTTAPEETLARVVEFFRAHPEPVAAVGIGSFGPLDLRPESSTYGFVTSTPKHGWRQADLRGTLARALGVPVAIDTDVNAAAVGEQRWGAARDVRTALYVTVGTGIGGGVVIDGRPLHGLVHPEIGHVPVARDRAADAFAGVCPYHGDCLEGLASGPAIEARWGVPADRLAPDHPAWALEAEYLARALATCVYALSPERILLGGGVMEQAQLFPLVRARLREALNGYVDSPALREGLDAYVVPPALGADAGVLGAMALAIDACVQ